MKTKTTSDESDNAGLVQTRQYGDSLAAVAIAFFTSSGGSYGS